MGELMKWLTYNISTIVLIFSINTYPADVYFDSTVTAPGNGSAQTPFTSLASLNNWTLSDGDTIYLACGSVWNEPLKLLNTASSVNTDQITITSNPTNCANKPIIDGSEAVSGWVSCNGLPVAIFV